MIRFTPWEAVVVAADVAIKAADVQIGLSWIGFVYADPYRRAQPGSDCSGGSCQVL